MNTVERVGNMTGLKPGGSTGKAPGPNCSRGLVRMLVLPAVLFLASAFALAGCGRGRADVTPVKPAIPVRTAAVKTDRIAPPIEATGILAPKDEVNLGFKIGGVIDRILVEEGDRARAGQPLASLDLREIDARVAQARSALEKADRDLARARRLFADSVSTLAQAQDAETALEVARAAFDAVTFDRGHAVIVAPSDGVVLRRSAEAGELVAPGQPILSFGSSVRGSVVRVGLADRDVIRVRRGDPAIVRFDAASGAISGTVSEIAAAADPATGTFRIEVAIPGRFALVSGLVAEVRIQPAAARSLAVIPVDALLEADGTRATVFALDQSTERVRRRPVTIAFLSGDQVAVAAGLEGVDRIVTDGALRLDDGDLVKVMP